MRIVFALAGLHRVDRGAEVALISIARELAKAGHRITLIGSGAPRPNEPYSYLQAPAISRRHFEKWPTFPPFRNDTVWEEATFASGLLRKFHPADFDVTVTCAFPFTHWALRRPTIGGHRPKHVFITENGDWPAYSEDSEFRLFSCDGLVCTNPEYFDRNRQRFRCELIANGVDLETFRPGPRERERFGLGHSDRVVLMVSALIPSKNVAEGIQAVAQLPDTKLVIAGDGPLRHEIGVLADQLLPGRFLRLTVPPTDMPALYRSADAFMHLSVDESFGNVFVEAIASGLPVVAYDTLRTRWIVGNNGYFARERSTEALVAALKAGLGASDAERASARNAARAFAWSAIGAQYENFFASLLEPSGGVPAQGRWQPDH